MKHFILLFFINQYEVEEGLLNDINWNKIYIPLKMI